MKTAVIHRRFGKTFLACDWLADQADNCPHNDPRVFLVFPYAKQGEEAAWDMVRQQLSDRSDVEFDKWRLEVNFAKREGHGDVTGPKLKLLGAEKYHKHRGKYADAVAFDETPHIPPAAWRQVFRPMLSDRLGRALFIGTPMGRDWFFDLYENGGRLDGWRSWLATVYDTGVIAPAEIEALRREMRPDEFGREYLCDFDVAAPGAYYQRQVNELIAANRATDLPFLPDLGVTTAWFVDKNDSIVVTFWQQDGPWLHCIETIRETNNSLPEMCREVLSRPYVYDRHLAPATLAGDSFRVRLARELGVRLKIVDTNQDHMDQVEQVRALLPRMRLDRERSQDLIEAARHYHAEYDEAKRTFLDQPVKDWSAEYCGALATFACGYNRNRTDWTQPIAYPERRRA